MVTHDRRSPTGPLTSLKGQIAVASTAVATTAAATQTATFAGALVGDVVNVSPTANLTASIAIAFARVVTTNTLLIGFTNVGASTAQAAVTMDANVQRR